MTWEELTEILSGYGGKIHVVRRDSIEGVTLPLFPVAYFASLKTSGELIIGKYEANRPAGGQAYALKELTPDCVSAKVAEASRNAPGFLQSEDAEEMLAVLLQRRDHPWRWEL